MASRSSIEGSQAASPIATSPTRRLKSDERYQAIPVLMVTAVDEQVGFDFARHVNAGHRTPEDQAYLPVDGYIVKPVKTVELLGAVERLLPRPAQQAGST